MKIDDRSHFFRNPNPLPRAPEDPGRTKDGLEPVRRLRGGRGAGHRPEHRAPTPDPEPPGRSDRWRTAAPSSPSVLHVPRPGFVSPWGCSPYCNTLYLPKRRMTSKQISEVPRKFRRLSWRMDYRMAIRSLESQMILGVPSPPMDLSLRKDGVDGACNTIRPLRSPT